MCFESVYLFCTLLYLMLKAFIESGVNIVWITVVVGLARANIDLIFITEL